jgi:hypothetical protein
VKVIVLLLLWPLAGSWLQRHELDYSPGPFLITGLVFGSLWLLVVLLYGVARGRRSYEIWAFRLVVGMSLLFATGVLIAVK